MVKHSLKGSCRSPHLFLVYLCHFDLMGYALNKQILQRLQAECSALPSLLGLLRDLISSEQYVN